MALVSAGYELTVTLVDNGGGSTKRSFKLRDDDPLDIPTVVGDILTDLNAVTDLVVSSYKIGEVFVEDALALPTSLNAQKEMNARVVLQLASSPLKKAVIEIPAPIVGMFGAAGTPAYNEVDISNDLLEAYVANFMAAGTAYISDGEDVAATGAILKGRRTHKQTSLNNPG